MKKKIVLLAIAGVTLCAAIVLAIVLTSGSTGAGASNPTGSTGTVDTGAATEGTGSAKPGEDTKPSDGTEPSEDPTEPSEGTEPGEGTEPSEDQTEPSEATQPSEGTEPTEPPATEPPVTEPAPTEPPATEPAPTEPAPTEPVHTHTWNCGTNENNHWYVCSCGAVQGEGAHTFTEDGNRQTCTVCGYAKAPVTEPPVTQPPADDLHDFEGYTPETITSEVYNSWSYTKQENFHSAYYQSEMTPEVRHHFLKVTRFKGYTCTEHDDHCKNERAHNELVENLSKPCRYCGQTNCSSFTYIDPETLYYKTVKCESYDIHKDPSKYCQTCGKKKSSGGCDFTQTCTRYLGDVNCIHCGVWVEAYTCHTCKQEDIDNYNGG